MTYQRTIRFADTDAAGVVYFASLLSICHEAYEAALIEAGVNLKALFAGQVLSGPIAETPGDRQPVILPIVHADIDFRRPLHCGDDITLDLTWSAVQTDRDSPQTLTIEPLIEPVTEFSIAYTITNTITNTAPVGATKKVEIVARANTRHVCVNRETRQRLPLPDAIRTYLD